MKLVSAGQLGMDDVEGANTPGDRDFCRKIARKFAMRRWAGELYVGKRMKHHWLARWLKRLAPPSAGRVLEVGCEDGCFTEWFDRAYPQATVEGVDQDRAHASACAEWVEAAGRSPKLTFRHGNLLSLPAIPQYDLIFCLDVLGYVRDDECAVRTLVAALKPGGRLVIHQPNLVYRDFWGRSQEVTPEMAGLVTEGHVRHGYTAEGLRALLSGKGLEIEALEKWHGAFSDVAHRVYRALEHPAILRFLALPLIDALWLADALFRWRLGNTVFAVARKSGSAN